MQDALASQQGKGDPVLSYESFLCCLVAAAAALRRPDVPYLSEALRECVAGRAGRGGACASHVGVMWGHLPVTWGHVLVT
jgi:hypothetical protein